MVNNKLLVILGPTATGKTDLGLNLAKKFNGEIISCDSRQVYTGLDIGTGKIPSEAALQEWTFNSRPGVVIEKGGGYWDINEIKIWMYDVVSPKKQYTVADYVKDARKVVDDILSRSKLPIIVGGSGLYLKALLEGLSNLVIPVDKKLRRNLQKLSLNQLQKKLQEVNPAKWESMNQSDKQNPRRLVRAIELSLSRLPPFDKTQGRRRFVYTERSRSAPRNDVLRIGLTAPREVLYKSVDERVVDRINQGMIEEAKRLYKSGLTFKRMIELGLEYGVLADYLSGKVRDKNELIKIMQGKIHGYVRRQLTWFKNPSTSPSAVNSGPNCSGYIYWFDITERNYQDKIEKLIYKWYYNEIKGGTGQFGR